jgi:hypothetical protein
MYVFLAVGKIVEVVQSLSNLCPTLDPADEYLADVHSQPELLLSVFIEP